MSKAVILHLKHIDWILLAACMALAGFSLPTLWALGQNGVIAEALFWKQLTYGILGAGIAALLSSVRIRIFQKHGSAALLIYVLSLGALGGLFFFGEVVRNTRAWYRLGSFNVAPVEFVKIVLVVLLAKFFSDRHRDLYTFRHIGISILYAGMLAVLVLMQPDAGSAFVLLGLWLGIILFTGIRAKWMAALCLFAALGMGLAWQFGFKPYQKSRIISFFDARRQPQGSGYNVQQSKVAIGSGGLFGKRLGKGTQGNLQFLPEASTDFMFAAFAEERGLAGILLLFALFCLVWQRVLRAGLRSLHNFGRIFAFGYALLLAIHFFVNVGMNLGMFPVVGIPLPFVSYGGSHMLANFAGLGIVLAIGREGG